MIVTIDPKYVNYIITVDADGKTTVKINIDKTGLPENAKKVHLSYIYIKAPDEPDDSGSGSSDIPSPPAEEDVPQPATGTVMTVGETVTIDENTEYPITGEFEIDGIPSSVDCSITRTEMDTITYANEVQLTSPPTISFFIEDIGNSIAFIGSKLN